ncbi:hypothetical protein ACSS6W_005350 [Trichoderma asperelloides]|uniref:Uncharacterized protein n=1 Tax=Trichoderma asperellum TaxID=101201 RepID=A0A6V8R7J8_TRIAP|nr:hypothetical protein TASIC1_0015026400 [Trichoderma asperellum]
MGCCFSSQASNASSHHEQGQDTAPPQQNPHAQTNANAIPEGLFAAPVRAPFAEPAVIPGNDAATSNEAITPNEAVEQRSPEFPAAESSSSATSDQHVILEPTVYVPPPRPSVATELEEAIVESLPEPAEARSRSSSSSSSSSSSG